MFSKKKFLLISKINFLILILLVVIRLTPITLSKYTSSATGDIDTKIAFYILDVGYQTEDVKIASLTPQEDPYEFNFEVNNYNEDEVSEMDIEYVLKVVTTTNLPLRYELYKNNQSSNLITATNTEVEQDEDGTYFQTFTMGREEMLYTNEVSNKYKMLIYYDTTNDKEKYQDTVEGIRVIVESKQIIGN